MVDARSAPRYAVLSGANRNDNVRFAAALDAIPSMRSGKQGRPR